MNIRTGFAGLALLALPLAAAARTGEADTATLLERLEEQERRVRILERKLELEEEAAKSGGKSSPVVKAGPTRFSIESGDGHNVARLRGLLHFDGRYYPDDVTAPTADTWILRRVRPTLEGTIGGLFDYRFTPDFAGGRTIILDAYATARLTPWAVVTAGKFKVPVGLERLASASNLRFIERGFPTSLVPNRDLGVQLSGLVADGVLEYSVGYFNGVSDGGSSDGNTPTPDAENDTEGDWAARVFLRPFAGSVGSVLRNLGFGLAGTYVDSTGSPANALLPSYRTPGQQTFFRYRGNTPATATTPALQDATFAAGERLRWTPQLYYAVGPVGVLGEYVRVSQDVARVTGGVTRSATLDHTAWQVQLAWTVTGEDQSFGPLVPARPFTAGGPGRGAVELVARYHELDIDDDAFAEGAASFADPASSATRARAAGIGINWQLNQAVKISLNYERTRFDGGAPGGADREDEEALLTRFAVAF